MSKATKGRPPRFADKVVIVTGAEASLAGSIQELDRRTRTVLRNMGFTLTDAEYDDDSAAWLKCIAENYGDTVLSDSGVISGFVVDNPPTDLPATTQLVQDEIAISPTLDFTLGAKIETLLAGIAIDAVRHQSVRGIERVLEQAEPRRHQLAETRGHDALADRQGRFQFLDRLDLADRDQPRHAVRPGAEDRLRQRRRCPRRPRKRPRW